ncbi:MAG: RNA polymerase subunit sigma [Xanthomonadales bacterium]|nr:RNA polymerase subunit sigma [Xanthomonadales bacterium]
MDHSAPRHETTSSASADDAERFLLERIAAGDQTAFVALHRAMGRRIHAYAMRLLGDAEQAEEIVSDTMYEVWKHPQRFNGLSRLSTWILAIARHRAIDRLRSPSRLLDTHSAALDDSLPDDDTSAYERIATDQRERGVRNCMDKLSDVHRECLHLVFYEGAPLADVARLQGCPENTVKTRLFHARKNIQNCLRLLLVSEGQFRHRTPSHA